MPAITDYGAQGPFAVTRVNSTGPNGQYTMFRPTTLGESGFLHPPTSWGNGITTTPDAYVQLLTTFASHGFVIIASNSSSVTAQLVRQGLDWLIQQNGVAGDFQGKLAVNCAVTIGYSLGGGAAVGAAAGNPAVKATISMHGLNAGTSAPSLSGPLLLLTSTDDTFVTKSGNVQPTYNASSKVPTIMGTLDCPAGGTDNCISLPPQLNGHVIPLDNGHGDRAPSVAWLRLWIYGDQGAKKWFYGPDCLLCKAPWVDIQRKNNAW